MNEKLKHAILARKSVRSYDGKMPSKEQTEQIKAYMADRSNYACPFGSSLRMELLEHGNVGTRNVIKKPPMYVIVIIRNTRESLIDAGYIFERFILFVESLGLNTCYLNSGFQRETVQLAEPLAEDEIMILASPIGFAAEKKSFVEKGSRWFLKAGKRKILDEMFFDHSLGSPVKTPQVREKLEYVRWAPSAVNAQPWRIIFEGEKARFYITTKAKASRRAEYNIHILDIGIALCHYVLAFGHSSFIKEENVPNPEEMNYILTVE
ncbi:hypothetical protein CSB45_14660 [candidate division KSB3 bacterium]|uniref:Putative nitroreductase TM1586 domain-containing protein n=1 Tax=candidate division KSB3 bacterium TaxID=2044937 RepID=A0A2G6E0Y5_9BACT|nr:MAG: hypothetical protein CSB45_14660 [candidate division KSB3 bacterium]